METDELNGGEDLGVIESTPEATGTPVEPELAGGNFIKVSARGNVKAIAGKIAHSAREGDPPAALCIGAECINLAVKAIAISRTYLTGDNMDLSFQPAFRDADRSKKSLALYMAKTKSRAPISTVDDVEMPIGSQSKPQVVAGALAARVREQRAVCLTAIGIDAVSNAVLAIGNARLYLEQDRKDIRAMPSFVQVHKNGRDLNAVKFSLVVENI
ncbi:hypothetical protein VOLCADRAFT_127322 [Volvox carteri f. nagariensis]|uniref:Uncharacterized protein n=1 Tax=Volvox carteri f. nagariensis TaxID=3068 RepID=D8THK9_VOLCA|nr:uncharacterized protein VOLCADRAFT_127322 [Volvox carteri f. nagariensis]EFJ53088.1 hypothetical protein VOLCADRAFT_127322 [Volvox carteri f. nagariensis]|eukprot:XP_002946093.1 hypothetical protein VOLCADRAFT_127322 [Volvox carteri f. nagariensis]